MNTYQSQRNRPIVIGAGIAGLSVALRLAVKGLKPIVFEKEAEVGGKAHQVHIHHESDDYFINGGPTVLTMLSVFEELYQIAGTNIHEHLSIHPMRALARHFWSDQSTLDLYTDLDQSFKAIKQFAGANEAKNFLRFHEYTQKIYDSVEDIFIHSPKPSVKDFASYLKPSILPKLYRADIHRSMWSAIDQYFDDPRLKQLFGRYATYTGNNPFMTPATFNLISAVEQSGVWVVDGGISKLAKSLEELILIHGGQVHKNSGIDKIIIHDKQVQGVRLSDGIQLNSSQVVFNGDCQALFRGQLVSGDLSKTPVVTYPKSERSLSALTACGIVKKNQAKLLYHNVYFSDNYEAEFSEIESGKYPTDPTIYFCAQDRREDLKAKDSELPYERIFALVNAPARGDELSFDEVGASFCQKRIETIMNSLQLASFTASKWTRPNDWNLRFPYSGGAIYGQGVKKWNGNLKRMGAKSRVKGLYLVGGTVHPGAGVPMAALSGKWATEAMMKDCFSTVS